LPPSTATPEQSPAKPASSRAATRGNRSLPKLEAVATTSVVSLAAATTLGAKCSAVYWASDASSTAMILAAP
jgi:hypothetical protein